MPTFGAHNRWYWTVQDSAQEQPVLYRSLDSALPNAGMDGCADIETNAELYFDVKTFAGRPCIRGLLIFLPLGKPPERRWDNPNDHLGILSRRKICGLQSCSIRTFVPLFV
jgi:hypothetical protein